MILVNEKPLDLLVLQCESESCGPSLAVLDLRPSFLSLATKYALQKISGD